ncbi:MAG: hypothetical protein JXX29_11075 [Deltaproteobacteria bacterium]|nr:hypothetical protein [Deltaproteobacteria bacterium]MBN2672212.1 hypothetical protein [Deltaproteobacteria bacterium]
MDEQITPENNSKIRLSGQLARRRTWTPLKLLGTVTGISLLTGLFSIISRYIFTLRADATAELIDRQLVVQVRYRMFGKEIRHARTVTPAQNIRGVRLEKQYRYIHFIVGFGFLMVGLFAGVHWLLDGIGAGYPYLALVGAGIICAGVVIDLLLYFFIPDSKGTHSVVLATDGWQFRFIGVTQQDADTFTQSVTSLFSSPEAVSDAPPAE